jgi:hypothetical protein
LTIGTLANEKVHHPFRSMTGVIVLEKFFDLIEIIYK